MGNNLQQSPETILVGEAKIIVKDENHNDRTLIWSELGIANVLRTLEEFQQASAREQQLARQLSRIVQVGSVFTKTVIVESQISKMLKWCASRQGGGTAGSRNCGVGVRSVGVRGCWALGE